MPTRSDDASGPRFHRGPLAAAIVAVSCLVAAAAAPYVPQSDTQVLAVLPAGAMHTSIHSRQQAAARLDVALPLAQFYISQARATGDLRFLGYADGVLAPWRGRSPPVAAVLVLHATLLQSRHAFDAALAELDQAVQAAPEDAQAWLTRATVLRVLGRYREASESCGHLQPLDPVITQLCLQSVQALSGTLRSAYTAVRELPQESLSNSARAWRDSELGEMAVSLGDNAAAEHWFLEGLQLAPDDSYTRAAYADLLLFEARNSETLKLLRGYESMEPLLLRIALAQLRLRDPRAPGSRTLLASAFEVEERRGDAVHRREQARFLLDVAGEPGEALSAAQRNWRVQRELADVLILLRTAQAAHRPEAAEPAVEFVREHHIEDVRLTPYLETRR